MTSICVIGWLKVITIEVDSIFATHQMSKCNGYCSSDSDDENMIEEHLVDNLPNSAINLLYYIEPHTIYHLQPYIYYIDDTHLYTRCDTGKQYHRYDLEPIRYMRIPLRLRGNDMRPLDFDSIGLYPSNKQQRLLHIVLAEVELLLTDERIRDEECINALRHNVYSQDGSIEYFASANNSEEEPFDEELDKLLFS